MAKMKKQYITKARRKQLRKYRAQRRMRRRLAARPGNR